MYKITAEFPFVGLDIPKGDLVDVYYTVQTENNGKKVLYIDRVTHANRTVHLTAAQEFEFANHLSEYYPV